MSKKVIKITPSKQLSKPYLHELLLEEAKRLNLSIHQMKDLLTKKCKNHGTDINSLIAQLKFLKDQKDLSQYSLDELAVWRNAASKRIAALKSTQQMLVTDIEARINEYQAAAYKVQKKLDSNVKWYKSLGKIISQKIEGVRFTAI